MSRRAARRCSARLRIPADYRGAPPLAALPPRTSSTREPDEAHAETGQARDDRVENVLREPAGPSSRSPSAHILSTPTARRRFGHKRASSTTNTSATRLVAPKVVQMHDPGNGSRADRNQARYARALTHSRGREHSTAGQVGVLPLHDAKVRRRGRSPPRKAMGTARLRATGADAEWRAVLRQGTLGVTGVGLFACPSGASEPTGRGLAAEAVWATAGRPSFLGSTSTSARRTLHGPSCPSPEATVAPRAAKRRRSEANGGQRADVPGTHRLQ